MKRLISLFILASFAFSAVAATASDEVVKNLATAAMPNEIAPNDARLSLSLISIRKQLDKAVQLTAEEPEAIAAACSRYAGHLHDSARIEATPLQLLEALASFGKVGKPMNDTLQEYATARKTASPTSHAAAMAKMAAMGRK